MRGLFLCYNHSMTIESRSENPFLDQLLLAHEKLQQGEAGTGFLPDEVSKRLADDAFSRLEEKISKKHI